MPETPEISRSDISHEDIPKVPQLDNSKDREHEETFAERHPEWPHIKLKFFFSPHETAKDMERLEDQMDDVDIYMYEDARGNHHISLLQDIAQINPSSKEIKDLDTVLEYHGIDKASIKDTKFETIAKAIEGRKTVIGHMDLRPGDNLTKDEIYNAYAQDTFDPNFETTLHNLFNAYKNMANLQDQREQTMIPRFEEELERIFEAHQELREKKNLKVLATMGSFHTTLFHKFREIGLDVERTFPDTPYSYGFHEQVIREFMFGKEPTQETLAKLHMEGIIYDALSTAMSSSTNSSYDQMSLYARHMAENFTFAEIKNIHAMIVAKKLTSATLETFLQAKGLGSLPQNNKALQEYFDKKKEAESKKNTKVKAEYAQRRILQK